jgi:hypothetical protein
MVLGLIRQQHGYPLHFLKEEFWSDFNTYPRVVADVNGDGKADIIGFSHSGVVVALSNGAGFDPATTWLSSSFS